MGATPARTLLAAAGAAWLVASLALSAQEPAAERGAEALGDAPDPVFFEERVEPLLMRSCATTGCHDGPGAGRLILARPDFAGKVAPADSASNLKTVLQFVQPGAPMESRLLLKPLVKRDGGLDHSGHHYDFRKDSEPAQILSDWIRGVMLLDVPPLADAGSPRAAKVFERVRLDGSGSRERRGLPLTFRWSIVSRPDGAVPILKGADTATPEFRADREGAYTLSLTVGNGRLESEPSTVTLTLDRLPFAVVSAEDARESERFDVVADKATARGRCLAAAQDASPKQPARAVFDVVLPEPGVYRVLARLKAHPAGAAAAESNATPLVVAFAGAPSVELWPAQGAGFELVAAEIAGGAKASGEPRLSGVGARIATGYAEIEGGALHLRAGTASPARLVFDGEAAQGSLHVAFRAEPAPGGERDDVRVRFRADPGGGVCFAAYEPRAGRVRLGLQKEDVERTLAEAAVPADPDRERVLKLEFREREAFLLLEDGGVLKAPIPAPAAGSSLALETWGRAEIVALRVQAGEQVRIPDFERDERAPGLLPAGTHRLEVRADGPRAPRLDEIHVLQADAGARMDDAKRREIRALHFDLLGRPPFPAEALAAAGLARGALARRLAASPEFWENWFEEELLHYLLIDVFRPRTPEMATLPARLANGQQDVRRATQEIVISQAFNLRNRGNDTFVSVVLEQLLGLVVQDERKMLEAGKRMYDGYPDILFGEKGKSQSDFVGIVVRHEAFERVLLARQWRRLFGSEPQKKTLDAAAARLRADPRQFVPILVEWIESDAYTEALKRGRPKSDHQFIRGLFVDLLGRKPTFEEFRNFRSALQALADTRPLRAVLARVLVDSGQVELEKRGEVKDLEALVDSWFLRCLGRPPSGDERKIFLKELAAPEAEPRLVPLALLSCEEYQTY